MSDVPRRRNESQLDPAATAALPTTPGRKGEGAPARAGRVAILGRPNIGKSTLLNALLGEPIAITSSRPQTTREPVRGVLTLGSTQYVFVDTPGLQNGGSGAEGPRAAHRSHRLSRLGEWMDEAARAAARDADALVLLVGTDPHPTDLPLCTEWVSPRTILAVNKIDRVKDKTQLLPRMAALGDPRGLGARAAAIVPVSARRADGVDALLAELAALLPEQPFLFGPDTLSDQPMRFFAAEFVREPILAYTRQEVPHGVAVAIERFDEDGPVVHIDARVHVARESHKKILIGAGGQTMKRIGMAARARIEQLLGRQVHLDLWVRVTPGWMNDSARLRELGYAGERAGLAPDDTESARAYADPLADVDPHTGRSPSTGSPGDARREAASSHASAGAEGNAAEPSAQAPVASPKPERRS